MISKSAFAVLLTFLAGCAGGPRPAAAPGEPAPKMTPGVYEIDGHLPGVGPISGWIEVDSAGVVGLGQVNVPCPVPTQAQVVSTSCDVPGFSFLGSDGTGRQRASVLVAVRTVSEGREARPASGQCLTYITHSDGRPAECIAGPGVSVPAPLVHRITYRRGIVEVRRSE